MHLQCFMRCLSAVLMALRVAPLTTASPLMKHMVEELLEDSLLQPRQSNGNGNGTFAITGIQAFGVQPRLEIRQLQENADQWNLYMLGLARMMAVDQNDKLSYYQIAGIHGRPYINWDGVQPAPGVNSPGYCTHISNIFLPWHRPYLALYEQVLYRHVIDAVNAFPAGAPRSRYARAALSFRMPYWDWAAPPPEGESVWPEIMQTERIDVQMPNGTVRINNPLFAYRFHPVKPTDFYFNPFATWNMTMRAPTSWEVDAKSQNQIIGPMMDNNRVSFQDRLYNLFTSYDNFTEFGNEAWLVGSTEHPDSLESIHDGIHGITGSNGHMTYLDYSAYDPVFWLHHTMIDRLFALFQKLHARSYVEPMAALSNTYAIPEGSTQDADSPLSPFHLDTAGTPHTARTARNPDTFGYTYPELANGANTSAVRAAINRLYGSSAAASSLSRRSSPANLNLNPKRRTPQPAARDQAPANTKHRQYQANILSPKFGLNGSYAIYIFLGPYPAASSEWSTAPNLAGTHAVFAALSSPAAEKNRLVARASASGTHDGVRVTGSVPLTSMLLGKVAAGELACLEEADVVAYLREHLAWRVAMFDNAEIPAAAIPGLEISVTAAEVEPALDEAAFPKWGVWRTLAGVTRGRAGGCF